MHVATAEPACHAGGRSSTRLGGNGADITAFSGRAKPLVLDLIADELDNQAELALAQQSLDCTDDPYLAVNGQPLTNSERLLSAQMAGRDHLVAAPKLIAIVDPSHRRTARYAHSTAGGPGVGPVEACHAPSATQDSSRQLTGSKRHQRPLAIPTKHWDSRFRIKLDRLRSWGAHFRRITPNKSARGRGQCVIGSSGNLVATMWRLLTRGTTRLRVRCARTAMEAGLLRSRKTWRLAVERERTTRRAQRW